ncbi:hypothetical protein B0H63DRAFT_560975 [Podospora didyma]|uniref:Distal membrane-arm assembly complex protein 1-like domain-containing protein n=1 Tax=Podospora didyma TaxID=330526 RepID=A0AAE0TVV0_9PEZI|nr:hypothetical protein B0H63DRAFT_560975 [Podospora didyma]
MAKDEVPPLHALEKPEKLQDILKKDRGEDCLGCRIVGSGAFFGLAAYSYFSGHSQLEKQRAAILASKSIFGMRARGAAISSISLGLAYLGFWRLTK